MQQFAVYRNRNAATREAYPLLLNVQSDLISETGTRVVLPLMPAGGKVAAMAPLVPMLSVGARTYVMVTPLLATMDLADLGAFEADLSCESTTILAAIDFLVSGV